jgi:hypothetical protein
MIPAIMSPILRHGGVYCPCNVHLNGETWYENVMSSIPALMMCNSLCIAMMLLLQWLKLSSE